MGSYAFFVGRWAGAKRRAPGAAVSVQVSSWVVAVEGVLVIKSIWKSSYILSGLSSWGSFSGGLLAGGFLAVGYPAGPSSHTHLIHNISPCTGTASSRSLSGRRYYVCTPDQRRRGSRSSD